MKRTAVYSGTFDPITLGHEDVARRAAGLFDELIIAVAVAHHKTTRFSLAQRIALAQAALADQPHIRGHPRFTHQSHFRVTTRVASGKL